MVRMMASTSQIFVIVVGILYECWHYWMSHKLTFSRNISFSLFYPVCPNCPRYSPTLRINCTLEHSVITFPLEALSEHDPMAGLRRAKRISSHTSFFKAGMCLGKTLVCVVKASQLSSTIKALEPIEYAVRGKSKPTFRKLIQGGNDTLRLFRVHIILW